MSSHSNRRIRAQRKRHMKLFSRLRDRLQTFTDQGRKKEALVVVGELAKLAARETAEQRRRRRKKVPAVPPQQSPAPLATEPRRKLQPQSWVGGGALTTPPAPEKQDPKVHGVNAQRETRSRPTVGGARGKRKPAW